MPYDDPDPADPMTLTGVALTVDDPGAVREMAACFVEEYLRLGLSPEAVAEIFESGEFAGPSFAARRLGHGAIREMIQEAILARGPQAGRVRIERSPEGGIGLPVLQP